MGYYISIFEKNSNWKIVQNVIKGNFYSDVVSFENNVDKVKFIQENLTPIVEGENNWQDFKNFTEFIPVWEDEIHFTFLKDLEDLQGILGRSRDKLLRADFCAVIDTNQMTEEDFNKFQNGTLTEDELMAGTFLKFYTLAAELNAEQVYTTVSFEAELDIFFTYDINNIWKENAQIIVERQVFKDQWLQNNDGSYSPLVSIDKNYMFDEELDISNSKLLSDKYHFFNGDFKGAILICSLQNAQFPFKDNNGTWDIELVDLLSFDAKIVNKTSVISKYLYIEYNTGNVNNVVQWQYKGNNKFSIFKYPKIQKIDNIFRKQEKYIMLYLSKEQLEDDNIYYKDEFAFSYNMILNSPEVIKIIPVNTDENLIFNEYGVQPKVIVAGTTNLTTSFPSTIDEKGNKVYFFNQSNIINNPEDIKVIKGFKERTYDVWLDKLNNYSDDYNPNQYAKMYSSLNITYEIINRKKQSLLVIPELLQNSNKFSILENQVILPEGNFSLVKIDEGYYKLGDLRTEFTIEGVDDLMMYQNKDNFIEYIKNNNVSINLEARIAKRERKFAKQAGIFSAIAGGVSIAGSIASMASSLTPNSKGERDGLGAGVGALGITSGVASIMSGINSLKRVNDQINRIGANLADKQSSNNEMVYLGTEFEKLRILDDPYNYILLTYKLPEILINMVALKFHMFGYAAGNIAKKPEEVLHNGRIFDFLLADFNSIYQALNERMSPQESKIAALSIAQGVRIWHITSENIDQVIGDYSKRNIIF